MDNRSITKLRSPVQSRIDPNTLAHEQASKGLLYQDTLLNNPLYGITDRGLKERSRYKKELLGGVGKECKRQLV